MRPETDVGFHGHHNLAMGIANSLAALEAKQAELPEGLHLDIFADESRWLKERTGLMLKNGQQGLLLVLLALSLFLRLRLAAWVTVGIPIALLGSAALMPSLGVSINLISLFGFIVVLVGIPSCTGLEAEDESHYDASVVLVWCLNGACLLCALGCTAFCPYAVLGWHGMVLQLSAARSC